MTQYGASAARSAATIDRLLAGALRDAPEGERRPDGAAPGADALFDRIEYHGIAGLLAGQPPRMAGWPDGVVARVREQAVAMAMWEINHKRAIAPLLDRLAADGIVAIVLKGTAVAYDLYSSPATRARGDTDLLVSPDDLARARQALRDLGFVRDAAEVGDDDFSLQEVWSSPSAAPLRCHVDLHWQLLNTPALDGVLTFAECASALRPLPRLASSAVMMDRVRTLIHTCIHRSMHFTAPYMVGEQVYYGGDRLIWLSDIALLAGSLDDSQWSQLCALCGAAGVAAPCLDGLATAQRLLGAPVPPIVVERLTASGASGASTYFAAGPLARSWRDLRAIGGPRRKLAYVRARIVPPPSFMRGKYPRLARWPLPLLYLRRMVDLVLPRARRSDSR